MPRLSSNHDDNERADYISSHASVELKLALNDCLGLGDRLLSVYCKLRNVLGRCDAIHTRASCKLHRGIFVVACGDWNTYNIKTGAVQTSKSFHLPGLFLAASSETAHLNTTFFVIALASPSHSRIAEQLRNLHTLGWMYGFPNLEGRFRSWPPSSRYYSLVAQVSSPVFPCSLHVRFRYRQRNVPSHHLQATFPRHLSVAFSGSSFFLVRANHCSSLHCYITDDAL